MQGILKGWHETVKGVLVKVPWLASDGWWKWLPAVWENLGATWSFRESIFECLISYIHIYNGVSCKKQIHIYIYSTYIQYLYVFIMCISTLIRHIHDMHVCSVNLPCNLGLFHHGKGIWNHSQFVMVYKHIVSWPVTITYDPFWLVT